MYAINAPTVIAETLDGETIIINTANGQYFTATGHASTIWQAAAAGLPVADIAAAFAARGLFGSHERVVERFVALLIEHALLAPTPDAPAPSHSLHIDAALGDEIPTLTCNDDLQGLIQLDPIHEVSPSLGWPFNAPGQP